MSKDIRFSVELSFSDKVTTAEEIKEIRDKILSALVREVDAGMGLAPEDAEVYTQHIRVTPQYLNETAIYSF